jgi:hypothetical protein
LPPYEQPAVSIASSALRRSAKALSASFEPLTPRLRRARRETCGAGRSRLPPQGEEGRADRDEGGSDANVGDGAVFVWGLSTPLADRVGHPLSVYLREGAVIGEVDRWTAREFAPHRLNETIHDLAAVLLRQAATLTSEDEGSRPQACSRTTR